MQELQAYPEVPPLQQCTYTASPTEGVLTRRLHMHGCAQPTFVRLNIPFDTRMANSLMREESGTALRLLYSVKQTMNQIKQDLEVRGRRAHPPFVCLLAVRVAGSPYMPCLGAEPLFNGRRRAVRHQAAQPAAGSQLHCSGLVMRRGAPRTTCGAAMLIDARAPRRLPPCRSTKSQGGWVRSWAHP